MKKKLTWNDINRISEIQNTFLREDTKIPISSIPELTTEIWSKSINHNRLSKKTKEITNLATPETLFEGYSDILENSRIGVETETTLRGEWFIMYDSINQMYWKLRGDIDSEDCVIMNYWINYVSKNSSTLS